MEPDHKIKKRRDHGLARVRKLADWMDDAVYVPVLNTRVGLDSIVGLLPGIGDFAGVALGGVAVGEAVRMRAPRWVVTRMLRNLAVDFGVGLVPIAGDVFDVYWKSNRRNLKVLEQWLGEDDQPGDPGPTPKREQRLWPTVVFVGAALAVGLVVTIWFWRVLPQLV